jgi:serine phosphatase RsbU (regulator of sigma subunit)
MAIFSDGVTEAENTSGVQYDQAGLSDSIARITACDVQQIGSDFFSDLDRFRMGAPAQDDTTFLVIGLE